MSQTSREKNQERLLEFLIQQECTDCATRDFRLFTFDHVNPKLKKGTVSELIHKGCSWTVVEKEIAKTDVVCHNCHIIREGIRSNSKRQQRWERLNGKGNKRKAT